MLARLQELEREAVRLRQTLEGMAPRPADAARAGAESAARDVERPAASLLDRLGHRFKNTLVLIQATAWQTGQAAPDVPTFLELFDGRLRAIAASSDVLAASGWRSFPLAALARAVLAEHDEPVRSRVRIAAEDLPPLLPDAAHNLALALHELTMNAVEHGALSAPGGSATLSARLDGGDLVLVWRETGGPEVTVPRHRGFGTALLERVVARRYAGQATFDWRPEGLVCTLRLPVSRLVEPAAPPGCQDAGR
jgi:two-component sensor histidine kinase